MSLAILARSLCALDAQQDAATLDLFVIELGFVLGNAEPEQRAGHAARRRSRAEPRQRRRHDGARGDRRGAGMAMVPTAARPAATAPSTPPMAAPVAAPSGALVAFFTANSRPRVVSDIRRLMSLDAKPALVSSSAAAPRPLANGKCR